MSPNNSSEYQKVTNKNHILELCQAFDCVSTQTTDTLLVFLQLNLAVIVLQRFNVKPLLGLDRGIHHVIKRRDTSLIAFVFLVYCLYFLFD